MLLFPEVQQAAQDELDAVIGHGRLPEMNDKKSLPYVTALKMEALRYASVIYIL
jgi:hypothetical protein